MEEEPQILASKRRREEARSPKSVAEALFGYEPKPPRDKTWVGVLCLVIICITLIIVTGLVTYAVTHA